MLYISPSSPITSIPVTLTGMQVTVRFKSSDPFVVARVEVELFGNGLLRGRAFKKRWYNPYV